jgi:hypothetical protein
MILRAISAALLTTAIALPAFAADAMKAGDAMMSGDAMMAGDAMMSNDMMMANDMAGMGDAMMASGGKTIQITIENLLTGQPFSPSYFETRTTDSAALFALDQKASDALAAVAEGGNIGMFSVGAAKNADSTIGDAALAIHTLPGQTRTVTIHVDENHALIDGVWMLGNTNDGFSGVSAVNAFELTAPMTVEVRGYDAGSEKNSEKKGFLGALGGGNERDPEDGVIAWHQGIRGDADAPKEWNWDVNGPVARVTFTPIDAGGAM